MRLKVVASSRLITSMFLLLLLGCVLAPGIAQETTPQQTRSLTSGQMLEREIRGGEEHLYSINLERGQFLHITVDQQGIDVTLALRGTHGAPLAEMNGLDLPLGKEEMSWEAVNDGRYLIEVRAGSRQSYSGSYIIRLQLAASATTRDRARIAAERLYMEAMRAEREGSESELQIAITKYEEAVIKWREASDRRWEGQTLNNLGNVYSRLNQTERARHYYEQALTIRREVQDRRGEGGTLQNLGFIYRTINQNERAREYYEQALVIRREIRDRTGEGATLYSLGIVNQRLRQFDRARQFYEQALLISREIEDRGGEAEVLNDLGNLHIDLNQNERAREYLEQALVIARTIRYRKVEGWALNNLGVVCRNLSQNEQALSYFEQALPIRRETEGGSGEGETLNNIGDVYIRLNRHEHAIQYYQRALAIAREIRDRRIEATSLNDLGVINLHLGQNERARGHLEQAITIRREIGDRIGAVQTLQNLGNLYQRLREDMRARGYFEQALAITREIRDRIGEGSALLILGDFCRKLYQYDCARNHFGQALAITREVGDKRNEAIALNNLGLIHVNQTQYERAREYYDQALAVAHSIPDRRIEAIVLTNLGKVYVRLVQYARATQYFERALTITREIGERENENYILIEIGAMFADLGQDERALLYYERSLNLAREIRHRDVEASALGGLAYIYQRRGQYDRTGQYLGQALMIRRELRDRGGEARALRDIGNSFFSLNQYQIARHYYEQMLEIARQIGDRISEAQALINLGAVHDRLGQTERAREYYEQALVISRETSSKYDEGLALTNLMLHWKSRGIARLAVFYGKQAINIHQQIRAENRGLERDLQQSYLAANTNTYHTLADMLISHGRLPEAEQVLAMLKEEEYFDFIRRDPTLASTLERRADLTAEETAALQRYREIGDRLGEISRRVSELEAQRLRLPEDQPFPEQSQLDQLRRQLEDSRRVFDVFLRQLAEEFTRRPANESRPDAAINRGLQADLQRWDATGRTAILTTVVSEDRLHVILTTLNAQIPHTAEISAARVSELVHNFRMAVQNRHVDPREAGRQLYDLLVKPFERQLTDARVVSLVWSLDGVLRYMPVSALYDAQRQQYMVERYQNAIITLASRTRLEASSASIDQRRALGLGVSQEQRDVMGRNFSPLPAVPEELRRIIREESSSGAAPTQEMGVLQGRRLLDRQFTREALERATGRYQLMHIASHFSFNPAGSETNSFLLLGDGSPLTLDQIRHTTNIFRGVELLTLSACDTATGGTRDATGREVESFGVLAQELGARAVMASLWPVADESTRDLMVEFYRLYSASAGATKAEALQQAQLTLLRGTAQVSGDRGIRRTEIVSPNTNGQPSFRPNPQAPYSHPYYWAPFILIGNWR
jgi:CHAT domain-containing protein/tetratricopeptide (TPR) repeat protein